MPRIHGKIGEDGNCTKHPSYKGIKKPTVKCAACVAIWIVTMFDKKGNRK